MRLSVSYVCRNRRKMPGEDRDLDPCPSAFAMHGHLPAPLTGSVA